MSLEQNFNQFFSSCPVSSLPGPKNNKLIIVRSDATLLEAGKLLVDNGILSAPVRDVSKPDSATWCDKYVGMIDLVGIAGSLLETLGADLHLDFVQKLEKRKELATKSVMEAVGSWRWGPFLPVETTSSLLEVVLLLGKYHLHRVPVVESGGDVVNIISQSSIVNFLDNHQEQLAQIGRKTLQELNLAQAQQIFSVSIDSKTFEAFKLIRDENVSAVGVTGHRGTLIGTVSATDIRLLIKNPHLFELLDRPLRMFFEAVSLEKVNIRNPSVRCSLNDPLEHVISLLKSTGIHRVFVVDAEGMPLRVLSLGDILAVYAYEPPGYFGTYFVAGLPLGPGL